MRNALPVRTTVPVRRISRCCAPIVIERTTQHRQRRTCRVAIQREQFLIERYQLRRGLICRSGNGIGSTARKLLHHVVLKCGGRHGRRRDDRKGDSYPLRVEKEE